MMFYSFHFCLRDRKSCSIILPLSVWHLHYLPIYLVAISVVSFYKIKNSKIIQIHFSPIKYYEEIKALSLLSLCNHILLIILVFSETLLCQQMSVWSRLWFFQWSCMDVRVGLWRKLSAKELMLLNCGVGEESWESLGLQDPTSPS